MVICLYETKWAYKLNLTEKTKTTYTHYIIYIVTELFCFIFEIDYTYLQYDIKGTHRLLQIFSKVVVLVLIHKGVLCMYIQ